MQCHLANTILCNIYSCISHAWLPYDAKLMDKAVGDLTSPDPLMKKLQVSKIDSSCLVLTLWPFFFFFFGHWDRFKFL